MMYTYYGAVRGPFENKDMLSEIELPPVSQFGFTETASDFSQSAFMGDGNSWHLQPVPTVPIVPLMSATGIPEASILPQNEYIVKSNVGDGDGAVLVIWIAAAVMVAPLYATAILGGCAPVCTL